MDLKQMALQMYPMWILGALVIGATCLSGNKDVVRVEIPSVKVFLKFILNITLFRILLFTLLHSYFANQAAKVTIIPTLLTLTVFWEDACHGLPLYLLKRKVGDNKWLKPLFYAAMGLVMLEFGLGHVYQGLLAAAMLSLYVPFSVKMGEKHGFGTVMLCHTIFDLTTIITMKLFFGA